MTEKLKNYKHGLLLLYFPFYLAAFSYLEKRVPDQLHIIDCAIDRYIPFIEVFIIPYLLWFVYIAIAGIYFFFREKESFCKLMYFGMIGMTIFIIVSYVYPNGQHLRPDLTNAGDSVFLNVVRFLYKIDTPTNIFPSMHVFNATASCIALYQNERCRKNRIFTVAQIVLGASIVLSTMFLKQHSVADVMTALILNILCYQLFYKVIPARQERLVEVFTKKEILTLPNLLSSVRLILAILFLGTFERYGTVQYRSLLVLLVIAAAATDILDGRIARSFNSVSQFGRILDPVADKAMQGVMLAYLVPRYPLAELVLILFAVKECYMMVTGWKVIMETRTTIEPQWHGKLNTAVTYVVVMLLMVGPRLPYSTSNVLIGACAVCMAMSLGMYASQFREILEQQNGSYRKMHGRFSREN